MDPTDSQTTNPRQQVAERIRTAVNVLVTVSNNPTVDQLAAAIGFTLVLNKLGKHATAVFSGAVPSTIEFLQPEETIEKNTDSLRDFIVSLDKSKADKLRYKVEENVVKIFITPYKSTITEKDLEFSQGDFNVDVVLALGVSVREQLDQAITAHGRILHDATVITVSAGQQPSTLGAINWQEASAASLCEMLAGMTETMQPNLLDTQEATAFLTGIVAQTDRFSNDKTTPTVMSLAAKLMAAGANQQLISTQLERATEVPIKAGKDVTAGAKPNEDGFLNIEHATPTAKPPTKEIAIDEHGILSATEQAERKTPHQMLEPMKGQNYPMAQIKPSQFTANMSAENETAEGSSDALSLPPVSDTLLSRGNSSLGSEPTPTSPSPTATLSQIEESVDSKHLQGNSEPQKPTEHTEEDRVNAALKAVDSARAAAPYNANRPSPLERLNSSPLSPQTVLDPQMPLAPTHDFAPSNPSFDPSYRANPILPPAPGAGPTQASPPPVPPPMTPMP